MNSSIIIELDEQDQKQLSEIFQAARMEFEESDEGDILQACRRLLEDAQKAGAPQFVMSRLQRLEVLVHMVEDKDWQLPAEDVSRVIHALAYFANSEDLIPDDAPIVGYLDDAVMVDLVMRELVHEVQAYDSFCEFREAELERRREAGNEASVTRSDWLAEQRRKVSEERKSKSWLSWKRKKTSFLD